MTSRKLQETRKSGKQVRLNHGKKLKKAENTENGKGKKQKQINKDTQDRQDKKQRQRRYLKFDTRSVIIDLKAEANPHCSHLHLRRRPPRAVLSEYSKR